MPQTNPRPRVHQQTTTTPMPKQQPTTMATTTMRLFIHSACKGCANHLQSQSRPPPHSHRLQQPHSLHLLFIFPEIWLFLISELRCNRISIPKLKPKSHGSRYRRLWAVQARLIIVGSLVRGVLWIQLPYFTALHVMDGFRISSWLWISRISKLLVDGSKPAIL